MTKKEKKKAKKGTIGFYACCESRLNTKQPCGARDLECEFKPIPYAECPFLAQLEKLPVCHSLLPKGERCRANNRDVDANYIENSEKVNNCDYGYDVFKLECVEPPKNFLGVSRTGDSKCEGRIGLKGSCGMSSILTTTMDKFKVPTSIKTVVTKGIELAKLAGGDDDETIDKSICLGDWTLKDWETSKATEGYGLSENGCSTVLAAGDTGSVSGVALKWPALVEGAPSPDICFTHNVCDGNKNSFAIGVGGGTTSLLLAATGLGPIFEKIGEVSVSVGWSTAGLYRTKVKFYDGNDEKTQDLPAQLYFLTKANTVNFAKQMCD